MIFRRGLRRHLRRTVVLQTRDGKSFRGVLTHEHADCLVLSQATYLNADQSLGGEAVILRENVSWMQDVTGLLADHATEVDESAFTLGRGERP